MSLFHKRSLSKGELRNVEVELVSLLFDDMTPANQKGAVVKSANGAHSPIAANAKFKAETVGTQGRLYVTLMEPGVVDAQGDSYSSEEIRKAADHFAMKGMVGRNDVNHDLHAVPEFAVVESYILKSEDKAHFPDTKIGAWVQVIKCLDLASPLWEKVAKGQFNGVSIYGRADESKPDHSAAIAELQGLLADLRKSVAGAYPGSAPTPTSSTPPNPAIEAIEKRIANLSASTAADHADDLAKAIKDSIQELNVNLKKAISSTLKNDEPASDQELVIDGQKIVVKSSHAEIYKGIATVDAGAPMNILTPTTTSLFIDEVVGSVEDDTLNDITVVPLIKDEKIDAGIIADLVLTNSLDEAAAAQNVSTSDITCTTGILTGQFTLGRDVVEFYKDKYGEAAFGAYVEAHIAKKTSKALRKLLFSGNRDASPGVLKALDGVIQLATDASPSDVTDIDTESYPLFADRFEQALLAFSDDVLAEMANFVFYISNKDLVRLRAELAQRETGAGDRFLLEGGNVSFAGIPVKPRYMPDNYIVAGLPKFIIIGYRTEAELKVEHHGSDWKYHWYIRVRPGITYVDGFVKVFLAGAGS